MSFEKEFIAFIGANGVGKTNLLNAIYYLGYSKVYRSNIPEKYNISEGKDEMSIKGLIKMDEDNTEVLFTYTDAGKKLIINGVNQQKITTLIGKVPVIMVTPDDIQIINDGAEYRRGFLDGMISQLDSEYLSHLMRYKKILRMRNAYLKNHENPDRDYIQVLDADMSPSMDYIFQKRNSYFDELEANVNKYYEILAKAHENITLEYISSMSSMSSASALLKAHLGSDILAGRTQKGIHKDDIKIHIKGLKAKDFASQGQKKSLLFALKLAFQDLIEKENGMKAIWLLDDVFEKLDNDRIAVLFDLVKGSQVFISDTNEERIVQFLGDMVQIIKIDSATLTMG